jgi:hypothetical protein
MLTVEMSGVLPDPKICFNMPDLDDDELPAEFILFLKE